MEKYREKYKREEKQITKTSHATYIYQGSPRK